MMRHWLAILIFFSAATSVSAQRHGRADAIQNYVGRRPPVLLLQIKVGKNRTYFRTADLKKVQRSVASVADPITGITHKYEGVDVEALIPNGVSDSKSGTIKVSFGSREHLAVAETDLDPGSKILVADTVDGKAINGYVPYDCLLKTRQDKTAILENVRLIDLESSP